MTQKFYSDVHFTKDLRIDGSLNQKTTTVTSSPYSTLSTDSILLVDDNTIGGDAVINLISAATVGDGYILVIKKLGTTGSVTVDADGVETIDGEATDVIEGEGGVETYISDGTNWRKGSEFFRPIYGSIYLNGGSTAQSIPIGSTYTKVTGFTTNGNASPSSVADAANDKLVLRRGTWAINGDCSFTLGTNNVTVTGTVFLDGVEVPEIHWRRTVTTGADTMSVAWTGTVTVDQESEDLDLRIQHGDGSAVDFTPVFLNLNARRIS